MIEQDEHLLTIEVAGKPEPQGSTTAFVPLDKRGFPFARGGRNSDGSYRAGSVVVNITSDNPKLKKWRKAVAEAAAAACGKDWVPIVGEALSVETHFFLERPEGHWGTGRNAHLLKESSPAAPIVIPDIDKLVRAVLDGLSGVVYEDDKLVTCAPPEKHYAVPTRESDGLGAWIVVRRRAVQTAASLPAEERERYVAPEAPDVDASQLALA